jgi:sugar-specific transcriptional regulator TrmB
LTIEFDEDIETLKKLGLNGVQAKAYLTLLKIGPSKANEIAKASNVARPDIYRTIIKLQEVR